VFWRVWAPDISYLKRQIRKDYLMRLRSPAMRTFKLIILDTLLWCGIMSMNLKNPKEQDDRKKGTLSNQPRLTRVTPTALLGSWGWQPIKDLTSLGTDFEMHAYRQGYNEEHPRPVKVVMYIIGDRDLDAGHHKMKAPTLKESNARKTRTIASGKAQGTYWNRMKCKERCGNPPEAVIEQATINLDSQVWKPLEDSLPKLWCADLAEAYVTWERWAQGLCVKKER
jgi:hypothetical protein